MKQRIELAAPRPGVGLLSGPPIRVVDEKPGPVTVLDQAKQYYKAAIALIGGILAVLPQVVVPEPAAGWVSAAIVTLTGVLTYLKANEVWVSAL